MTIASEITKLNTNLTNSYTAVSGKGGTLPSAQNFDNLATAIDSIPSGTTPVITSLNVTPTTSAQTITAPSGTDGYSPINVSAVTSSIDNNITAGNIKSGVSILGVTGTYSGTTPTGTLSITANGVYDVTNYANADVSVSGGGGSQTKYGSNVDTFLGDVNASGVLQLPTEQSDLVFTGVKDVVDYCLYNKFSYRTNIKTVLFPDLESLSNISSLNYVFYFCTALTSVSFPKLEVISGTNTLTGSFYYCTALTSVSFPKLTSITSSQLDYTFSDCTSLTTVSFPELTTMSVMLRFSSCTSLTTLSFPKLNDLVANNNSDKVVFNYVFTGCTKLKDIYFNSLKTTSFGSYKKQFQYMFNSGTATTSNPCTVHFPSNLSSKIATLTGYPLFGGTSGKVVLSFDLPATS